MHRRLHSASFQVNITFSLDQRGEDILKAVNVYHGTPRENRSNGKIMLLTSHQSLFGWLCDYEWVVGCALTFFFVCGFVSHYGGERTGSNMTRVQVSCCPKALTDSRSIVKNMHQSRGTQTINVMFFNSSHSFGCSNLLALSVQLY